MGFSMVVCFIKGTGQINRNQEFLISLHIRRSVGSIFSVA